MNGSGLTYTIPAGKTDLREIIRITRTVREGCEPFMHCALDGEKAAERFLVGKNGNGITEKLIFSYGGTACAFDGQSAEIRISCSVSPLGEIGGSVPVSVQYCAGIPAAQPSAQLIEGTRILQTFLLMTDGKMTVGDEMRYTLRVRASMRSLSTVFGSFDTDGQLVSTASIVAENEKYALIGDVFTRADKRGRGLAAELCLACCRASLEKGKIPWLMCAPEMLPYYTRLGFREIRPHSRYPAAP